MILSLKMTQVLDANAVNGICYTVWSYAERSYNKTQGLGEMPDITPKLMMYVCFTNFMSAYERKLKSGFSYV